LMPACWVSVTALRPAEWGSCIAGCCAEPRGLAGRSPSAQPGLVGLCGFQHNALNPRHFCVLGILLQTGLARHVFAFRSALPAAVELCTHVCVEACSCATAANLLSLWGRRLGAVAATACRLQHFRPLQAVAVGIACVQPRTLLVCGAATDCRATKCDANHSITPRHVCLLLPEYPDGQYTTCVHAVPHDHNRCMQLVRLLGGGARVQPSPLCEGPSVCGRPAPSLGGFVWPCWWRFCCCVARWRSFLRLHSTACRDNRGSHHALCVCAAYTTHVGAMQRGRQLASCALAGLNGCTRVVVKDGWQTV
jgi:hypothetical protein